MVATSHPQATLTALDDPARRRQRGRRRDRRGGDAMRRRAREHRHRRRLLRPRTRRPGAEPIAIERRRPGAGQGACRMVRRARQIREIAVQTRRIAATVPGAIDAWCVLNREHGSKPLVRNPRTGGQGGRGRLCRDAARRLRLGAATPSNLRRPDHRQGDPARRQGAEGRRHDRPQPGAGRARCAGSAARGARPSTRAPSRATSSAGSRSWAGCTRRTISRRSAPTGSSRSTPPIAATTSTNARRPTRA